MVKEISAMSGAFGSVRQLGFVVRDLNRDLGALDENPWRRAVFHDSQCRPLKSGTTGDNRRRLPGQVLLWPTREDLQIEIIQQHDDHPTGWRDFLASGREGFQHVSSWLDPRRTLFNRPACRYPFRV